MWLSSCGWHKIFGWYVQGGWMSVGHLYLCSFKTNPTKGLASPRQADSCLYRCMIGHSCGWVCLLTCAGREADGYSREYYFSSGRLKVLLLIRRFLCVETLQWNEHLRVCSTSSKMLNRIYPLMGVVNCAFGSICLAGRCIIVKFLQPNKILEDASLQEETWWLLSADASLKPGEKHVLCSLGLAPTSAGIAPGYWCKVHGLQRACIVLVG